MTPSYPTRRPTDATYLDEDAEVDLPTDLLTLPWIDPHNHAHTLSWADRERYAIAGCRAMLMVASGYHWTPYKPVRADDVRFLWDDAINRRRAIERDHFYEVGLGLGIHTGVRVEDPDVLLAAMDEYAALDEVVAVGETGVTPTQQVESWALDEQRAVVEGQMAVAARHDLPAVLHTLTPGPDERPAYRPGLETPGYEKNGSLATPSVVDADDPSLEAVRIDVAAARDAGLPDERVVASHADLETLPYLMTETECHASFTIGHSWLVGVTVADVAEAIEAYGPERIMVDTDCANVLRTDPFALKRAIFELYRLGIDEDAIRRVVYENARDVFGLGT